MPISRRSFLAASSAVTLSARSAKRPPNIVLILADDLGYECLSSNGATGYKTPNLDRLAAQGLRFTHAHAMPLCTPTRVQLMTGRYNLRNYRDFGSLPPGELSFAHILQQHGYRTGVTGKWQLAGSIEGQSYQGEGQMPRQAGFDESLLWQVKTRGSRYWDPLLEFDGRPEPVAKGKYGPDLMCDFACSFFERHRNRPFCFYYPMVLTHDPFQPTPRSEGITEANKHQADKRWFADMVAYMDHEVGRLVNQIDELGLGEDTLILFLGDNGTSPAITSPTVSGPYLGGKGGPKRNGTHVPMLARWTGAGPRGAVCHDLIDTTDFLPTMVQAAGARVPAALAYDGQSFLPQLQGRAAQPREWLFFDYNPRWGKRTPARWVMNKQFKLYDGGPCFDYLADPDETRPIQGPPEILAQFRQVLARYPAH